MLFQLGILLCYRPVLWRVTLPLSVFRLVYPGVLARGGLYVFFKYVFGL